MTNEEKIDDLAKALEGTNPLNPHSRKLSLAAYAVMDALEAALADMRQAMNERDQAHRHERNLEYELGLIYGERDALRTELADWREASAKVLADKCPSDEKHCACVVFLRKELDVLRKRVEAAQIALTWWRCTPYRDPAEEAEMKRRVDALDALAQPDALVQAVQAKWEAGAKATADARLHNRELRNGELPQADPPKEGK